MSNKIIIGIDPGQTGGISFWLINKPNSKVTHIRSYKLPIETLITNKKKQNRINVRILSVQIEEMLQELGYYDDVELAIYIEKVHAIKTKDDRQQGVTGIFRFGCSYGLLLGMLQTMFPNETIVEVHPRTWITKLFKKVKYTKTLGYMRCKALGVPDRMLIPGRCRTPQDGVIDAALIAWYGFEMEV